MVKCVPVQCTKEEMDAIILAAKEDRYAYLLFKVARKTGRRLGEYFDIQVKDFDGEKKIMLTKVLNVKREYTNKQY